MTGRFERPAAPTNGGGVPEPAAMPRVPAGVPGTPAPAGAGSREQISHEELQAKRDALARELAERQWDLGGLTYEMAIRDHFRLDVLVRKAADLQQVDAELGEVERILTLQEGAASGMCSSCGAPHSRGAVFCWQCGSQLMATAPGPA